MSLSNTSAYCIFNNERKTVSLLLILCRWKNFPEHTISGIIDSIFQECHGGGQKGGRKMNLKTQSITCKVLTALFKSRLFSSIEENSNSENRL